MKQILRTFILLIFFCIFAPGTVLAESGPLELLKDIEVHGFASSSYVANFNDPVTGVNNNRIFDTDHNSFKFDVGELVLLKEVPNKGDVGFRTDITFGFSLPEGAKAAPGPGVTVTAPGGGTIGTFDVSDDDFDLQQGYVSWNIPVANGLVVDFGKFNTHVGLEVFMGYDDQNWNFSRSFLYGLGQPFTHSGMRASYSFTDQFSAMAMISDGWDRTTDDNDGKTFGVQLVYSPLSNLSLLFNWAGGPEIQASDPVNEDDNRNIYDWIIDWGVTDQLSFIYDISYAVEDNNSATTAGEDAIWWGFESLVRYEFNNWFALNLRGEYFEDLGGVRTPIQGSLGAAISEKLWEFSITPEFRVNRNLIIRAEYRHDESNINSFGDGDADFNEDSQDTISLNAMFYF